MVRDVRLFDGERVFEHRSVLVENGKISRIGGMKLRVSNAEIIDGRGRTLLHGLFDAHVHVPANPEPALRQLASLGVTTARDMFGGGEKLKAKKRIESEDPAGMADLRASGFGATTPGSGLGMMARQLPAISSPGQGPAWVDARIAEGSDFIKIIRIGGPLDRETLQAIVQAAHGRGKLVVAHVLAEQKAREAIAAGVDGLAHLFIGDSAGSDFGQFAAADRVSVIPTLSTLYSLCGKPPGPGLLADPRREPYIPAERQKILSNHLCMATDEAMRQLIRPHVPVLAGTDSAPTIQIGAFVITGYGASLHGELQLLVNEGMTPVQALVAATSAPARAFHLADRVLIRPKMRADLVSSGGGGSDA